MRIEDDLRDAGRTHRRSRESGNLEPKLETVAPCSCQGQALGPRFREDDDRELMSINIISKKSPVFPAKAGTQGRLRAVAPGPPLSRGRRFAARISFPEGRRKAEIEEWLEFLSFGEYSPSFPR